MQSIQRNNLASFHKFISQQLASNAETQMSPEEALAVWKEREETIGAVREGLSDVEAGHTYPADIVIRELREELRAK